MMVDVEQWDRRRFLKASAATVAMAGLSGVSLACDPAEQGPFRHGVASGDPLPDSVILWTRLTPTPDATPGSGLGPAVQVRWEVALDDRFETIVSSGTTPATADADHTVKVDATGLAPGTDYFYRFQVVGDPEASSLVGRTRTAPDPSSTDPLRFGVAACGNWTGGYFSAYRHLAARQDISFVLFLGDYIYEYGNGEDRYGPASLVGVRDHVPPTSTQTLADYRARYGQYRSDPNLLALHLLHPIVCMWDDHELADDAWREGALDHDPAVHGPFQARKSASHQAYLEWLPVRESVPGQVFRELQFGQMADLRMLDLRSYRDAQASNGLDPAINDPDRTITGEAQMEFLLSSLRDSTARWKLNGNPVMITPVAFGAFSLGNEQERLAAAATIALGGESQLPNSVTRTPAALRSQEGLKAASQQAELLQRSFPGVPYNVDQWDGYRADRAKVLDLIAEHQIDNVVFLTGDIHSSWACDVPRDAATYPLGSPSVATELVVTSATSDNVDEILEGYGVPAALADGMAALAERAFQAANDHIKYLDLREHGYGVVDFDDDRAQMDWFFVDRMDPASDSTHGASWTVPNGIPNVMPTPEPLLQTSGQVAARRS